MTGRDRIVLIGVIVLVVLAAAWLEVVSPERQKAGKLNAQVAAAQSQLASAEGTLANARAAQSQYATAYASMVSLGKAVPPSQEVPSLIYQLALATRQKRVEFASIGAVSDGSSASTPAAASASSTSFTALPFTFVFEGSFFGLERLFRQLTSFTTRTRSGDLEVSGRLLTIQSVKLAPTGSGAGAGSGELTGSVSATAYVAPAGQGLSATASGSTATPATTSPASTAAASSSTAPAIIEVNP
jgi:Tfp pilus assembly protein PilO